MPERHSLLDRLEHAAVRGFNALAHPTQLFLAGGAPIRRGDYVLHPELQLILRLRRLLGGTEAAQLSPGEARRRLRRDALVHRGPLIEVGAVRELSIGAMRARHYIPTGVLELPALLVYFHGGGFVTGDLDTHDNLCRKFCRDAGVQVLSVDYRLAPEEPFPAAVEDGRAAFAWAVEHARELGADPERVAVGGDSAGGNLAAVVSQLAVKERTAVPAMQLLLYPAVDRTRVHPSMRECAEGFFLTAADLDWYTDQYVSTVGADVSDPRISPLLAKDFGGLPPALVVTAGFDPLCDEGEAYARALEEAGVPVVHQRFDGLIHGFLNMTGVSAACRDATDRVCTTLKAMLSAATRAGDAYARAG